MTGRVEKVGGGSRLALGDRPRARRIHDARTLDAETWFTNSSVADVAVVWAKLDGEIRPHRHALGRHHGVFARQLVER